MSSEYCATQFFQAGVDAVELGQTACEQSAYSVSVHGLPIICCSNTFNMRQREGLSDTDATWLQQNVIDVDVPLSGRWWIEADEAGIHLL